MAEIKAISESTKVDIKFAFTLALLVFTAVGSFYKLNGDMVAMRYELQAEITRVESEAKGEQSAIRIQLITIQDTLCALAKKQDVTATGCR